jgi:hypothetical protein
VIRGRFAARATANGFSELLFTLTPERIGI